MCLCKKVRPVILHSTTQECRHQYMVRPSIPNKRICFTKTNSGTHFCVRMMRSNFFWPPCRLDIWYTLWGSRIAGSVDPCHLCFGSHWLGVCVRRRTATAVVERTAAFSFSSLSSFLIIPPLTKSPSVKKDLALLRSFLLEQSLLLA